MIPTITNEDQFYHWLGTYIAAQPSLMEICHVASLCSHVSEIGVHDFSGTMMLLSARPQVIRCYDSVPHNMDGIAHYAATKGIDYAYVCAPETVIEDTELLATACHLDQLLPILKFYEKQVSKYIVLQRLKSWDRALANATINHFMQTCLPWHIHCHIEDQLTILYRR